MPGTGFFAYPSAPPSVGETIREAIAEINRQGGVTLFSWEDLRTGGRILVNAICSNIVERDVFLADLTYLNPNVLFELGFAIARQKKVWLSLDSSITKAKRDFESVRTLSSLGYRNYQNSHQLCSVYYADSPHESTQPSFFEAFLQPHLEAGQKQTVLYLKSLHDTQASIRLSRRLQSSLLPMTMDDPKEGGMQPLIWYVQKVYSSIGVVASLCDEEREGASPINALYAMVAGIAHGFGKPLLMLAPSERLSPLDYRELGKEYSTAAEADRELASWLVPIVEEYDARTKPTIGAVRLATELKQLRLGEHIAENEGEELAGYFVDTTCYQEALQKRQLVVVGRKGAGKSALLLRAAEEIGADKRNVVVVVKPVSYDLEGVIRLVRKVGTRDARNYLMESLWKYILYSEIAQALFRDIDQRVKKGIGSSSMENSFLEFFTGADSPLQGDFSMRLERALASLDGVDEEGRSLEEERKAISEALHEGILATLRRHLGELLHGKERVAVLVDNLDKAWDRNADFDLISEFLLGLLSAIQRMSDDFQKAGAWRKAVNLTLVVFLRSDIFAAVRKKAREPDKIAHSRIVWDDSDTLIRVVDERFRSNRPSGDTEDLWSEYVVSRVNGVPTKNYVIERILPRPRDLIVFMNAAIATAVNRGHAQIEEADVRQAEFQYSQFALDTLGVETSNMGRSLESVFIEFAGSQSILTEPEIEKILVAAGVPDEGQRREVMEELTRESFLGIEVGDDDFAYAVDEEDLKLKSVRARKLAERRNRPRRFTVHPAFRSYLGITPLP